MKQNKKIAMFGGTFNPFHLGHLFLVQAFSEELELDELLLIPARVPPHKQAEDLASGSQRMEMCRLAVKDYPEVSVSDIELRREGKSYTVDTLHQLQQLYPGDKLYLIMGADMFLSLDRWFQFEEIMRIAVICAAPRDDSDAAILTAKGEEYREKYRAEYYVLKRQPPRVSSTEIRTLLAEKGSVSGKISPAVEEYIRAEGLYLKK